jgi:CheY-like chemotaxis protein
MGYSADVACSGLEVLQLVQGHAYDLVLMDVEMPGMDGLETSLEISKLLDLKKRPYITAVTANALQGDRDRCLRAGMDDYISKPIRIPELIEALQRCPSPELIYEN